MGAQFFLERSLAAETDLMALWDALTLTEIEPIKPINSPETGNLISHDFNPILLQWSLLSRFADGFLHGNKDEELSRTIMRYLDTPEIRGRQQMRELARDCFVRMAYEKGEAWIMSAFIEGGPVFQAAVSVWKDPQDGHMVTGSADNAWLYYLTGYQSESGFVPVDLVSRGKKRELVIFMEDDFSGPALTRDKNPIYRSRQSAYIFRAPDVFLRRSHGLLHSSDAMQWVTTESLNHEHKQVWMDDMHGYESVFVWQEDKTIMARTRMVGHSTQVVVVFTGEADEARLARWHRQVIYGLDSLDDAEYVVRWWME